MHTVHMPGERDKHSWRRAVLAQRAALTETERITEASALAATAERIDPGEWVCAYVPVRGEPGSLAMLDALRAAGARVLLPMTEPSEQPPTEPAQPGRVTEPAPLRWAEYTGADELRKARYGLLEPNGNPMPSEAISRAELVLVPALAVDRRGVRLGRGAGYYDRTLGATDPNARVVVVVRDEELVDRLPEEPHDVRMGWVLTPYGGLQQLERVDVAE